MSHRQSSFADNPHGSNLLDYFLPQHHPDNYYNPEQNPPNLSLARKHGKAKKVYRYIPDCGSKDDQPVETCPCCSLPLQGDQLPLKCDLSDLYHLGSGYALYFEFLKGSIVMLGLIWVVNGIYNLTTNASGNSCSSMDNHPSDSHYCVQDYILTYTIANKRGKQEELQIQLVLNLVTVVLMILFYHYIRYQLRKINIDADSSTITPSDYTVMITGVSTKVEDDQIKEWMESLGNEECQIKVEKVVRAYDLVKYVELSKIIKCLKDEQEQGQQTHTKMKEIENQMDEVGDQLEEIHNNGFIPYAKVVFVTLETAKQAQFVRRKFRKTLLKRSVEYIAELFAGPENKLHKHNVRVIRAPEPTDILWQNLGFNKRQRRQRRNKTISRTVILEILSLALITGISWAQTSALNKFGADSIWVQLFSLVASVFLAIINYALWVFITKLTEYEKWGTYTEYYTGIAEKLSIAQFVNSAFTTLIAKIITTKFLDGSQINFYGAGGLLEAMFWVFAVNALSTPLYNIFDLTYFWKLFQQWRLKKNIKTTTLTQAEAHSLFEGCQFDLSYKYAVIIKTCLLTAFYAPAIPVSLLFGIGGLLLVYYSDKYILLRRAALQNSLADEISTSMIEYLETMACMFAVGNLLFVYTLKNSSGEFAFSASYLWIAWLMVVISLIHVFLPMDAVNKKLFKLPDALDSYEVYKVAKCNFFEDYDTANPVTHKHHLDDLKRNKSSPDPFAYAKAFGINEATINLVTGHSSPAVQNIIEEKKDEEGMRKLDIEVLQNFVSQIIESPWQIQATPKEKKQSVGNNSPNQSPRFNRRSVNRRVTVL